MSTIRGRYVDGKVIFDNPPADWPEGAGVRVALVDPFGELLDDECSSPEAIARSIALMEQIPVVMTQEEYEVWKEQRAKDKAAQLAMMEKWERDIGNLFR